MSLDMWFGAQPVGNGPAIPDT